MIFSTLGFLGSENIKINICEQLINNISRGYHPSLTEVAFANPMKLSISDWNLKSNVCYAVYRFAKQNTRLLTSPPTCAILQCVVVWLDHSVCRENKTKVDFRLAPSQWETSLQSNAVSHWLGANLVTHQWIETPIACVDVDSCP